MNILIFGATGSIGKQAIEVINKLGKYNLVGISFFSNLNEAEKIIKNFNKIKIFSPIKKNINNVNSYEDLIIKTKPDIILNAISGMAGLEISFLSLKYKKKLLLANKESMVIAGKFLLEESKKNNIIIIPIDSELTSLLSLYKNKKNIKRIIITASGGKFFNEKLVNNPSFNEMIKHPKWNMGERISIDSSTMINKYFELIEATYFFDCEIDVLQHSQAIIHSIIEYNDGSINMYGSNPDMKIAIQNGLYNFDSNELIIERINFDKLELTFNEIDEKKWIPIKWAKNFIKNKNFAEPIIINAANEALFDLFKNKIIKFDQIVYEIKISLLEFKNYNINNKEDIYKLHNLVYKKIKEKKWTM